jgi:hypothetical protein
MCLNEKNASLHDDRLALVFVGYCVAGKAYNVGCAVTNGCFEKNAIIWDTYQISCILFGNPIDYTCWPEWWR